MIQFRYENGSQYRHVPLEKISLYTGDRVLPKDIDFKSACIETARNIYNENNEIYLALSGGVSSQICLRSFIEAGLKPNVLIIKFPDNLNIYDTGPAVKSCKHLGIIPLIVEVLPTHLYNVAGYKLIEKYQLYDFFDLCLAWVADKLCLPILVVDSIDLRRDVNPKQKWSIIINEGKLWTKRFNTVAGKKLIVDNFFTTPKSLMGFLKIPIITDLLRNKLPGKISAVSSFKSAFNAAGFKKMDGYVPTDSTYYLGKLRDNMADEIYRRTLFDNRKFYIPVDEYVANPEKKIWKYV